MQAVFLADNVDKVYQVYKGDVLKRMEDEFQGIQVFTKMQVIKNQQNFSGVKYIFSTWSMPIFSEQEIKLLFPELIAVFYAAGTVKHFAEPFINCGVKVYSASGVNSVPVAEFTTAQVILANKGYFHALREYRKPFYSLSKKRAYKYASNRQGNYGAKIGIIGAGSIGKRVLKLLSSLEVELFAYDPYVSETELATIGVNKVDLQVLFETCDVISNHLPDIPETRGMLNYFYFSKMKKTSTFINTGRGGQIVEKDLLKVLKKHPEMCALLDVTGHEPVWPWSALLRRKNVFLSPHIAGSTGEETRRMGEYMYNTYREVVQGKVVESEVTKEDLKKVSVR